MKSLAELQALRDSMKGKIGVRDDAEGNIRVVVGMATCGIAAGARPVLTAFTEEVSKRNLQNVTIAQTGCIGICQYEPVVEVYEPGKEKVTYVKMTPEKAVKVVNDHLVNGNVVTEYTIGAKTIIRRKPTCIVPMCWSAVVQAVPPPAANRSSPTLEHEIQDNGLAEEVKVVRTGCFGLCALGPIMIVYPEGAFYSMVKARRYPRNRCRASARKAGSSTACCIRRP